MNKHILFLDATYLHKISFFLAARELGLTVSVVGPELPEWAEPYVDCYIPADTHDIAHFDAVLLPLRQRHAEYPFDGVITFWDHGVVPTALVADAFGLPGSPVEAAKCARNKYAMRQALQRHQVAQPRFAAVTNWRDLQAASATLGYPLVFKPLGGAGSAGVFKIETPDELRHTFEQSQRYIIPERDPFFAYHPYAYIVEEFMEGREISMEGIVAQGSVHIVAITDKWTTAREFTEYQHAIPARLDETHTAEAIALTTAGLQALQLDNCGFHAELKLTPQGCKLVEINGRLGGDFITSHLVPLACGVDIIRANLLTALGEVPDLQARWQKGSCIYFLLAQHEGVVRAWRGVDQVKRMPGVVEFGINKQVGERVLLPPKGYFDLRVGFVITQGKDAAEAIAYGQQTLSHVECVIDDGTL